MKVDGSLEPELPASLLKHHGVPCCAYPIPEQYPKSASRSDAQEKEREQISNRMLKWKRALVPLKQERWCCALTNLMSLGNVGIAAIHGHHLYGGEGFPSLRYVVRNGVLLNQLFHMEFHKTVQKPLDITPTAFLIFLRRLDQDESYLVSCLKRLREELQLTGWLTNCKRHHHPITGETTYSIKRHTSKGGKTGGSVYLPAWLRDNLQAGLPLVKERVRSMRRDVECKVVDLDRYLSHESLIPDGSRSELPNDQRNRFIDLGLPDKYLCVDEEDN